MFPVGHNPQKVNNDLIFKIVFVPSSLLPTSLSLKWKREHRPLQARVGSPGIIFQKPGAWQGFRPSLGATPPPTLPLTPPPGWGKDRAPATAPPPTVWPCSREAKRSCPERLGTWPGNPKLRGLPPAEKGETQTHGTASIRCSTAPKPTRTGKMSGF